MRAHDLVDHIVEHGHRNAGGHFQCRTPPVAGRPARRPCYSKGMIGRRRRCGWHHE
jgi:hypothetical protein